MIIEVFISKALLCIAGACHPALVGQRTPRGTFTLERIPISAPQYGGDVLKFAPDGPRAVFAIHRAPTRRRRELLWQRHTQPVTLGCINVTSDVYEQIKDGATLVIRN